MFSSLSKTFLTGLFTLLPVVLTIYLLYWIAVNSEQLFGHVFKTLFPNAGYYPGVGMLFGILAIFAVGLMMKTYIIRQLFRLWEDIFYRLPLVKTIYSAFRDFFDYFSNTENESRQVVLVNYNGFEAIGFITQDKNKLPKSLAGEGDKVLVYFPMSYNIGGYSLVIPRERMKPIDMSVEDALRYVLTAGITGSNKR